MKIPKPSSDARSVPWLVTTLLVLLLVLVPVLAWFQYQWTGEASRAEVFRMRSNLRTTLLHWSADFQSLINLGSEPGFGPDVRGAVTDEEVLGRASQLLEAWNQRNEVPGLVTGAWVTSETQAWYLLADGVHWSEPVPIANVPSNPYRSTGAFVRAGGRRLLVDLNPSVLSNIVVPILVGRYFAGTDGLPGYRLTLRTLEGSGAGAVLWTSQPTTEKDLALSPELGLNLLGNGDRFGPVLPEVGDVFSTGNGLTLVGRPPRGADRPVWVLEVRHVDGSLEAAAERVRWLNLSGTFTLLSVLTFGFLFLYRLYNRNRLAVRAQQDFVSSVSHELKSPLAVLRAAAENLKEGVVSEPGQARRYGERMLSEADRLLMLTENILRYAGLEAQPWSLEGQESVNLTELLQGRVAAWAENFRQKGATLVGVGVTEPLHWVKGRAADLTAIVDNLLSNALKHGTTGTNPSVTVDWGSGVARSSGTQDPEVFFSIQDNGKGLAPKEQKKVFEPFYRPPGTTVSGVGLGLSLVARLASSHGGRVELKSAVGSGALFTVLLPASEAPREQ
ncbi:MAG: HAMP domain-containing sensor histidine kinase [Spirochaetales bacterium]